mgnify:CR=1 FL=1
MHWNVDPVLLHVWGPFAIRWYSILFLTALLLGYVLAREMFRWHGKPDIFADNMLNYIVIGTIVGARLGHCLFYDPIGYLTHPLDIFKIWEG